MKTLKHYEKGCLNCGTRRKREDILAKTYDIYLKDDFNKTLHTAGLCKDCYEAGEWDLDKLQANLLDSETEYAIKFKRPKVISKLVKTAAMTGAMSFEKFWTDAKEAFPKGFKLNSQVLGLVGNVRTKEEAKAKIKGIVNELRPNR